MKAAVDALVAGAPDALDTLIELANALNNDPNFAATMATELGKKLNIADIVNNLTSGGTNKRLPNLHAGKRCTCMGESCK